MVVAVEGVGRSFGLPSYGGCDVGGGVAGFGDLRIPSPEYSSAIYCNQAHYGPVSGGEKEARDKGGNAVVGTGGFLFGGDVDGGLGDGSDGGDRGEGWYRDCGRKLVKWGV